MKPITMTFVLTGANAGKTVQLAPNDPVFVNGRARFTAPGELMPFVANRLSFYGAFMMGSPELEEALKNGLVTQEQINGNGSAAASPDASRLPQVRSEAGSPGERPAPQDAARRDGDAEGPGGSLRQGNADGNGLGSAGNGKDERLVQAIRRLDPTDASLWTADGKPLVDKVASIYGNGVTRAMIEAAIPGFTREVAAL